MKHQLILVTLVAIATVMLGIPLLATLVGQARGAGVGCMRHRPVGADGEFVWDGTSERVGT